MLIGYAQGVVCWTTVLYRSKQGYIQNRTKRQVNIMTKHRSNKGTGIRINTTSWAGSATLEIQVEVKFQVG